MRKKVDKATETKILTRCRRRCAICFGLHRDTRIRPGQIAHLNKNNSDNRLENLVFLCLEHHDQFDSRTSQSKNFTQSEVEAYQNELEHFIQTEWSKPVDFDGIELLDIEEVAGHYIWKTENASAELDIEALGNREVAVTGIAFWGTQTIYGPNMGELDFKAFLGNRNTIQHFDPDTEYRIEIKFLKEGISVAEQNHQNVFGMNVSFEGTFINATKTVDNSFYDENTTTEERDGNIFLINSGLERQLTFVGTDRNPMFISPSTLVFIRTEECIGPSLEPEAVNVKYQRNKIMTIDVDTLFEKIISIEKPYEDGLDGTTEILSISSPTLSLDRDYLYFVTEKWVTSGQLVKVNVHSGDWVQLFPAASFELIKEGKYIGLFLVAFSEIRGKGRDIYYKLCDESGKMLKEFDTEDSLMKFRSNMCL